MVMKCFHPQVFNDNTVACGRCPACRQNRINGWVVRLEKHQRHQESAHFITLTYSENNATMSKNGLLTLDKSHLTLFFKRLRNLHNAKNKKRNNKRKIPKIGYYAAGEYGSRGGRPHYHLILFNADAHLISPAWSYKTKQGNWTSRGNIHTGTTTGPSIRYSLKYISKPSRIPLFKGDDRTPEFSHMSKGIGAGYLTPAAIKWHREDLVNRYFIPVNGGRKMTMPRYYSQKIYSESERQEIGVHLELKTSDEFYKALCTDTKFLENFVRSQKYIEQKAFIKQMYTL